jgi:hypothetical protein
VAFRVAVCGAHSAQMSIPCGCWRAAGQLACWCAAEASPTPAPVSPPSLPSPLLPFHLSPPTSLLQVWRAELLHLRPPDDVPPAEENDGHNTDVPGELYLNYAGLLLLLPLLSGSGAGMQQRTAPLAWLSAALADRVVCRRGCG